MPRRDIPEITIVAPTVTRATVAKGSALTVGPAMPPFDPFAAGVIVEPVTQHHTVTQSAIIEQHVEQTVVHETHVGKQIVHERHIDQPVIHERHIDQPVIHERHIDQPVIHERHYEQPVIHERHIDKPIIHERHIEKPIIHEKHIEQPIIHEKHYEQPVIHEKHIVKPVIHEVHISRPVIHNTVVTPTRVGVFNHAQQMFFDQQYTAAETVVMAEHATLLPAQIMVERTLVEAPITVGQNLAAHTALVSTMTRSVSPLRSSSPTVLPAPRSPSYMSALPRSPTSSSTVSSCSSMTSAASMAAMESATFPLPPPLVPRPGANTAYGYPEPIVVEEPPVKPTMAAMPAKAERNSHRHSLRQRLDQKLHRHH